MTPRDPVGLQKTWQRTPSARVVEHREATTVVSIDGRIQRFAGASGELVAEILRTLSAPCSRAELVAKLGQRFEAVAENGSTIDAALELLVGAGAIREVSPPSARARSHRANVVLGVTGAVASAMAPQLAGVLVAAGFAVRVATTKAARKFVQPLALEAITHQRVVRGLWDRTPDLPTPHINLAEWADVVVICPATATTLSRLATGDCSDVVSATAIATRAPVVVVPSMNAAMYEAPAVRRNLGLLRDDGVHLVMPTLGHEVAHAPGERQPASGPAPSARDVLALIETVLASTALAPSPAASAWDARYRDLEPSQLPWHTETLDDDLRAALEQLPSPQTALDVGTGLGTVARELARRGLKVTATDISSVALSRAQAPCAGLGVVLVEDDITRSQLRGPFDVVIDRGVLHTLTPVEASRWRQTVERLVPPGAHLLVKVHAQSESREFNTQKFTPESLQDLLAPAFVPVSCGDSVMSGSVTPAPRALLGVFRRAGTESGV